MFDNEVVEGRPLKVPLKWMFFVAVGVGLIGLIAGPRKSHQNVAAGTAPVRNTAAATLEIDFRELGLRPRSEVVKILGKPNESLPSSTDDYP
jgi:hypothetical protein